MHGNEACIKSCMSYSFPCARHGAINLHEPSHSLSMSLHMAFSALVSSSWHTGADLGDVEVSVLVEHANLILELLAEL